MEAKLKVTLLNYTPEADKLASLAAKLCYSDSDIEGLQEKIEQHEQATFIEKIVKIGHHSVLEHVTFTFGIEGVSRALTHQLVRHRIASYSQKSQRYVKYTDGFEYIFPESIKRNDYFSKKYKELMGNIAELYKEMLEAEIPAEDARYILPNACETKIIVTMNARELLHFFRIRCCNRAQWEIRILAEEMLKLCLKKAPAIFRYAGPGCVHGKSCPEGEYTCGSMKEVREKYSELLRRYGRLN